jgi:hypothetical protein
MRQKTKQNTGSQSGERRSSDRSRQGQGRARNYGGSNETDVMVRDRYDEDRYGSGYDRRDRNEYEDYDTPENNRYYGDRDYYDRNEGEGRYPRTESERRRGYGSLERDEMRELSSRGNRSSQDYGMNGREYENERGGRGRELGAMDRDEERGRGNRASREGQFRENEARYERQGGTGRQGFASINREETGELGGRRSGTSRRGRKSSNGRRKQSSTSRKTGNSLSSRSGKGKGRSSSRNKTIV